MEVVSTVVSIISCLEPLSRNCKYLRRYKKKANRLENKMEELSARAIDIKRKLDEANVQGREPKAEVTLWAERVTVIESKVHSLMTKVGEQQGRLIGCIPNYHYRLKLGKQIEENTKMVTELLDQGQFPNDQLTYLKQEKGKPLSTTTLVGKPTAERTFKKIWEYIMDDSIQKIGVYGMGGVGKTTIMQNIHNRLLKESTAFDKVIWITVSKDSTIEKLQNDIGKEIDLDLKNYENEVSRASQLLEALKTKNRFILILDNMWNAFPLEKVGIPNPTRENSCKVVLTTRLQGVCRGKETQRNVQVMVLTEEEAWDLFKDKVGEGVFLSSDIKALAKDVAKECGGLPLALITIGLALRQIEDVMEWKNALNELRASTADIEGLEDQVFRSLKFSYAKLRNDQIRACFLYCALYPEDYRINVEELVEHWIGEGLINDLERREDQIYKARTILNELKYACMLENVEPLLLKECVKMHDLIRDLAIRIQSPTCIIKAGFSSTKGPKEEEWIEQLERVSLMRNNLNQLMGEPSCPKLSSLLLQENPLEDISPPFFHHMYNLKVINIPEELMSATHLRNLQVYFRRGKNYTNYLGSAHWRQLARFTLHIGAVWVDERSKFGNNSIFCDGIDLNVGGTCFVLPDTTHMLRMSYCNIRRLSMCLSNLEHLKQCKDMGCKVMAVENYLPLLDNICKGDVAPGTLSCLRVLHVYMCDDMRSMLTRGLLQYHLQWLEQIIVEYCEEMEEIVEGKGEDGDDKQTMTGEEGIIVSSSGASSSCGTKNNNNGDATNSTIISLPRLHTLKLYNLPNLKSICTGVILVCNSLQSITIYGCEKLRKVSIVSVEGNGESGAPPAVRKIIGNKKWWDPLTSDHPDPYTFLQPFDSSRSDL